MKALFKVETNKIPSNLLSDRFLAPPFSVLDTKQGYWQDRKQNWLRLGIASELGREDLELGRTKDVARMSFTSGNKSFINNEEIAKKYNRKATTQTSIFDPVLCELMYKWFSLEGHVVFDPFAGGSVRGLIATMLNRHYCGVDLSEHQISTNKEQFKAIKAKYTALEQPNWICDDSMHLKEFVTEKADFIFSCPPYYNLERYSTKEEDLSYKDTYEEFLESYREIIKQSCDLLNDNSFAVFVVSNIRDKNVGTYYNFVGDTVQAFLDAGLYFYNDLVLLNAIGTAPIRAPIHFNNVRKVEKCHQNVLVFYKGNLNKIREKFGSYEV